MKNIKDFLKNDNFAAISGIEILEASPGYAKARMNIEEKHLNALKTVQGGAIFTLADLTFAAASNAYGNVAVAINANISFVKAATGKTLTAEAKETSINPKISTYTVNITDDKGDLVAIFHGMGYRKKISLDELSSI
ncbi:MULTISPECIES: PaaI family thioesterase [Methanosarcina]|uniref:Phenylacetic acid degradation protein paaI n=1 Tax=Methanosarcina vacuolata Z-761 TaxID=1434123 RepID=A0A0E3Q5K4_9EURY|nr:MULTISPECIES: PaaI family thioesterase [Methanosarcina]AKB44795.1 Phenylacetic acid degradation protein paaI [Methanosarcina vacuolata Z-761]AKB48312.1 Phenylacetic acid degradation protein paaI [Methanosarcina sp. Kolksee]